MEPDPPGTVSDLSPLPGPRTANQQFWLKADQSTFLQLIRQ